MAFPICRVVAFLTISGILRAAAPTSLTVTSSANPAVFGQPVTLTATISPSDATGKVTFYYGATILGVRTLGNGAAALATTLLPSGSQSFLAYYGGDARYNSSRSPPVQQMVNSLPSGDFATVALPAAGASTGALVVADFNGDGKADLAITYYCHIARFCPTIGTPIPIGVALGNGDGSFQPVARYQTSGLANFIAVGDFNGDGIADIVVTAGENVTVLLGNGDGTFQPAMSYPAQAGGPVLVGDLNGDGICDLVVAGLGSISVLLGNGDGSFQSPLAYAVGGSRINGVALADFNQDGKPDLVVCNGQTASVLSGNGDGTFQSPVNYAAGNSPATVTTGDFNGDGNVDLAVGSLSSDGGMFVLLGNGDGTFQPATTFPLKNYSIADQDLPYIDSLAVGDFDGDGKLDLAVVTRDTTAYNDFDFDRAFLNIFLGNGDGTFHSQATPSPVGDTSLALAVADFNGDGRTDLAGFASVLLGTEPTTTALISSLNPSAYEQSVTLTASVSPVAATGRVTFYDGATVLGTVAITSGQAVLVASSLATGLHSLSASYSGDTSYSQNTSPVLTQVVNLITTPLHILHRRTPRPLAGALP